MNNEMNSVMVILFFAILQLTSNQMLEKHFDTFMKKILEVLTLWKIEHDRGLVRIAKYIMSMAESRDAKLQETYLDIKKTIDTL